MIRYLHIVAPLAVTALVTAACAQPEVEAARALHIDGRDATSEAAREYKRLAIFEADFMRDRASATTFSEKALAAAHGRFPTPQVTDAIANAETRRQIRSAYRYLAALMAAGADRVAPQAAGQAMARLDCWAEQAAEGYQAYDIAHCRQGFHDYARDAAVALKAAGVKSIAIASQAFTVTFPSGSTLPSPGADAVLDKAAEAALADKRARIVLGGHTDRNGSASANVRISEARARRIAQLLTSRGVDASRISTIGFGETYPRAVTPDGERSAENRRVEIVIGPGGDI